MITVDGAAGTVTLDAPDATPDAAPDTDSGPARAQK